MSADSAIDVLSGELYQMCLYMYFIICSNGDYHIYWLLSSLRSSDHSQRFDARSMT